MRARSLAVAVVLLITLAAFATPVRRAAADDPPGCRDFRTGIVYSATMWLDAPGTLVGTAKRDVLVGSTGSDTIKGGAGNDLICTEPFNLAGGPDVVNGGAGDDRIAGLGHLAGGSGGNFIIAAEVASVVDGGSGSDELWGINVAALLGGSGADTVLNFGGAPKIDCGSGTDVVDAFDATDVRRCELAYWPS